MHKLTILSLKLFCLFQLMFTQLRCYLRYPIILPFMLIQSSIVINIRTSAINNIHNGFTEPLVSATQNSLVSLPAVLSRLRDKTISGKFIDFTSFLSKAMFSGSHYAEPSKLTTVHLNPEKDDLSVRPTQPSHKITSFKT